MRARFASEEAVQEAALDLERHGIDGSYIRLSHADPREAQPAIDRGVTKKTGTRSAVGAVAAAVIGGLIGLAISLVVDAEGGAVLASVIGGAGFGFFLGAFYGVAVRLPTNPETLDAEGGEPDGRDWLEVAGPADVIQQARTILRDHHPTGIDG